MARSRYTIVRKLAAGGMAEIYLATQHGAEGFQRPVVLKRILGELSADPQFRNALIDEAHVAMGLTHSNIAQVLDLGTSRGRYFLAMELVDGWDLNRLLRRGVAAGMELPAPLALYVITEVCRALAYAHGKTLHGRPLSIVHRDISPHNVLVSEQGEVKLTDFGIAKALIKRDKTATGVVKGKISFMAPEQACGAPLDARADLFSLGVTLYVALTGVRPFDAGSELETLLRVREARFEPPDKVRPGLPPALCRLVERAMRKEPKDRYQSAEEMLLEAERVLRTLQPAGPTELKRWLAALCAKDGKLPPSQVTAGVPAEPPPSDVETSPEPEEAAGASVELDEAAGTPEPPPAPAPSKPPQPPPLPPQAPPRPMPTASSTRSLSLAIDVEEEAGIPHRGSGGKLLLFLVFILAGGALYVWQDPPLRARVLSLVGQPVPGATDAGVAASAEALAADASEPSDAQEATDAELPADASPGEDAATPEDAGSPEDAAALDAEQEEPANALAIDAGEEPEVPDPTPDAGAAPAPAAAPRPAVKQVVETVSIRVLSEPPGASVKVEKTVFGTTPMRLRFRPGITYELQFLKPGYQTGRKLVTVTGRGDQVVSVTLVKEPARKKR